MYYIFTQHKHIATNKQFCEITKDNQKDQNLVNYNKSYIGVNVIIGNLVKKKSEITSE